MEHPVIIDSRGKAQRDGRGLIAKYISSPIGRATLAASMIAPLRTTLDYASVGRKCFMVQQLPQGAQPIYNNAPDVTAMVMDGYCIPGPQRGYKHKKITIDNRGKARDGFSVRRVIIPKFEIFSNPTVRITDIKQRRFNLIDRVSSKTRKFPITISSRGKAEKYNRIGVMNAAVQHARMQIMQQEDENIFKILDSIAAKGFEK